MIDDGRAVGFPFYGFLSLVDGDWVVPVCVGERGG